MGPVMAGPTLVFRTYREGDEVAINRVFEGASGLVRSLDEWAWLYPPEEDGRVIVVAETGGEVVAHCAGTPLRVVVDGRELAAARITECLSLAPEDEIVERVAETFFESFASSGRFPLVVACPQMHDDSYPRGFDGMPKRELAALTRDRAPRSKVRRLCYRAESARDWEPRLDDLWHRVRGDYPVAVVRDAEGVLSRFAGLRDLPEILESGGRLCGLSLRRRAMPVGRSFVGPRPPGRSRVGGPYLGPSRPPVRMRR